MWRHIPKEYKEIAMSLSLHHHLSDNQIRDYMGISPCTMKRLRKLFQDTGELVKIPVVQGRPQKLNSLDAHVSKDLSPRFIYQVF